VHKVPLDPQPDLPLKIRSLQGPHQDDWHALVRRWATLYEAASDSQKSAVVDAFSELTGLPADRARKVITGIHSTPLLQLADDKLREVPRPKGKVVFLHADLWAGNMMWNAETSVVLIDWKDSGVGDPGVDLGHLRMKMAVQYGPDAATHVLDGWQRESGHEATNLAYWDAVAALHTPTHLDDWEPGFDQKGTRLRSGVLTERRDIFLRTALDQLASR
jgi:Ser/Thr protein kinase RdoA (MazF antagonist)